MNGTRARPVCMFAAMLLASIAPAVGLAQNRQQAAEPRAVSPSAEMFRQAPMDSVTAMIAYHRIGGLAPDFSDQVERSQAYRSATTFDRDQVKAREMARLEALYRQFDPSRVYLVRLSTQLNQYDMGRRGYPIPLNETSFVNLRDPVTGRAYGVQFRNPEDINFINIEDVNAARSFAQRFNLNMQSSVAASGVALEIAFRMVDTASDTGGGPLLIRADAVAARVLKDNRVVHEFTSTSVPARPPSVAPGAMDTLKSADIQGIRLGMPAAEAQAIGTRTYSVSRSHSGESGEAFFEKLSGAPDRAVPPCGIERAPAASAVRMAEPEPFTVPDTAEACLSYRTGPGNLVTLVTSGQRMGTATRDQLRAALEEKYGRPTYMQENGVVFSWTGRDPANPEGPPVQVNARIEELGQGALRVLLLGVELRPASGPAPRQGPASGGPRL